MSTLAIRLNSTHWLSTTLLLLMVFSLGCERRTHYRRQADAEASSLVAQGGHDPRWELGGVDVYMDPRSRYFEEYSIDKPPMPQDDPASHQYMLCVDGKRGYRKWNQNGFRGDLANSQWMEQLREYVEVSAENEVVLNTDSALRLAQVNSPAYQQQLETMYLSALDVSTERFRLQTQFYNGMDLIYNRRGEGRGGEQNDLRVLPDSQFTRQFATAGTLLVGFANSFVWQFTGNDTNNAFSLINFNLVQPLLRGGGRVIGLERLTLVERSLLANLRAFQRYRQGFYTNVTIGQGVGGLQRRGGFQGGTGLTGFSGTGQGGFGGVGAATGFGGFGGGGGGGGGGGAIGTGLAGGGAGTVGGFIGLLQSLQELRNAKDSLDLQLRTLSLLEGNLEAGLIDLAQVDQFRQSIETQRAQLLQAQNGLQSSIDSYLTGTLGLPPNLPVRLDDTFIQPFQLIDPQMTVFQNAIYVVQDAIGATADDDSIEINAENVGGFIAAGGMVREEMTEYFEKIRADFQKAQQVADIRMQSMNEQERDSFLTEQKQLQETLDALEKRLVATAQTLQDLETGLNDENAEDRLNDLIIWLREFLGLHQEISLAQARARLEAVSLDPIRLDATQALTIAKWNRLDLMNNRAALVDSWRLIAFNANALNADLDFTVRGDWQTTGNNILNFQGDNSSLEVGARFDSPFTRLLERNNYRQSLIDYQQSRRQLIQFEDGINQTMRNLLRQLDQLETNLEIQRRAVAISIRRVDFTQAELNRPLPVPAPGQPAPSFGPTAVQNLSSALADLRNSQNNFMSVWLNYYTTRMTLMRELGIMQLDDQGRWIDDKFDVADYMCEEAMEELPEVPRSWIERAFEGEEVPQEGNEQRVPLAK